MKRKHEMNFCSILTLEASTPILNIFSVRRWKLISDWICEEIILIQRRTLANDETKHSFKMYDARFAVAQFYQ